MKGPNGPCTSIQTLDSSWTTSTPGNAGGTLDIRIADDGSYTIRFGGPVEETNGNTTDNERTARWKPISRGSKGRRSPQNQAGSLQFD